MTPNELMFTVGFHAFLAGVLVGIWAHAILLGYFNRPRGHR